MCFISRWLYHIVLVIPSTFEIEINVNFDFADLIQKYNNDTLHHHVHQHHGTTSSFQPLCFRIIDVVPPGYNHRTTGIFINLYNVQGIKQNLELSINGRGFQSCSALFSRQDRNQISLTCIPNLIGTGTFIRIAGLNVGEKIDTMKGKITVTCNPSIERIRKLKLVHKFYRKELCDEAEDITI